VGHDVDLLVHPDDLTRGEGLVREVASSHGLFVVRVYHGIEHHGFYVADSHLDGRLMLKLDVQTALRWRGRMFIDHDDLLRNQRRGANAPALAPGMEAYALLLHAALHKGMLEAKYAARLQVIEEAEPGALVDVASDRLGPALAVRLGAVRTDQELLPLRGDLGRAIDRRYPQNRWGRTRFTVKSALNQGTLRLRPHGVFIAFLGPDGSGKTTTTEALADMLGAQSGPIEVHRVHLGSGQPLLPTRKLMRRIRARNTASAESSTLPREPEPRRLRGAIHVMLDVIVRYWVRVRPRLAPAGIVLADGYAYDVFRVNNPAVRRRWFRRIATAIIPAPDITFFLEGDPEEIATRKNRLSMNETMRQQEAYREIADRLPRFRSIDLSTRDQATLRGLALEILKAYAARNGGLVAPNP
jgi:thymidylate kinase